MGYEVIKINVDELKEMGNDLAGCTNGGAHVALNEAQEAIAAIEEIIEESFSGEGAAAFQKRFQI